MMGMKLPEASRNVTRPGQPVNSGDITELWARECAVKHFGCGSLPGCNRDHQDDITCSGLGIPN